MLIEASRIRACNRAIKPAHAIAFGYHSAVLMLLAQHQLWCTQNAAEVAAKMQVTQWASVRIEAIPPGWRPLLVFLNTKSGPQTGARMRRRFLRCLNPLQVRFCS